MRRIIITCLSIACSVFSIAQTATAPFSRGVNFSSWLDDADVGSIQFAKYTKQDFENIKSLGMDVIRLPIRLHDVTSGEPDYIIDPIMLRFLDSAVSWAESLDLHLIIDNHTFSSSEDTDPDVGTPLNKTWAQMAEYYKDSYDNIYYEVLNEPHGLDDDDWNSIQKTVIETIREYDTKHTIIVGATSWNSYNNLAAMPEYEDDNLIYTFHFYDPFLFTHQGASWTDPSMEELDSVPFPYADSLMPEFPSSLEGTWIESSFNAYSNTGTVAAVKANLDIAIAFRDERNVPIYCGEFGVYQPNSQEIYRVPWYDTVRSYMEENGIAWTMWDYTDAFGLFTKDGNDLFEHDLNIPLVEALGLTAPEQTEYVKRPDSTGLYIYTDYVAHGITSYFYTDGEAALYDTTAPNNGYYCLYITGGEQYDRFIFDFDLDKDFSVLADSAYYVDFMFRGLDTARSFNIRFMDTDTNDTDDHPWRMGYTIDESITDWDGAWHHISIPLSDFNDSGAWDDDTWYTANGSFEWTNVDLFEIVCEQSDMGSTKMWFDNIHITDKDTAMVYNTTVLTIDEDDPTAINSEIVGNIITIDKIDDIITITTHGSFSYNICDTTGKALIKGDAEGNIEINCSSFDSGLYIINVINADGNHKTDKYIVQ